MMGVSGVAGSMMGVSGSAGGTNTMSPTTPLGCVNNKHSSRCAGNKSNSTK